MKSSKNCSLLSKMGLSTSSRRGARPISANLTAVRQSIQLKLPLSPALGKKLTDLGTSLDELRWKERPSEDGKYRIPCFDELTPAGSPLT